MAQSDIYIVAAARTAIGAFQGALSDVPVQQLGVAAIQGALARAEIDPKQVDETYMGNVLSAGVGQAPARQAAIGAGLAHDVPATTVSKVCGSGLQSVILGAKAIRLGDADVVVAGGMESMTRAPYLLLKARAGYRMGNGELIDSMVHDGLWDPYNDFHMGKAAELCAREHGIHREEQDEFAAESYRRALAAQKEGRFAEEIVPVTIATRKGERVVDQDEEPGRVKFDKITQLRPAFDKGGSVTAANASKINDGAAAVLLAGEAAVRELDLKPLARIVGYGGHAQAPEWFTTAPAGAIATTLKRTGLRADQIDLFEINEAFAVVCLACTKLAELDPQRINVRGGAVALGHPIGASGTRILTTLLHALHERAAKRGLATLCIGGGEALAIVVEAV